MDDPRKLYTARPGVLHDPRLRGLDLVVALTGFAEAGATAQQVADEILDGLESEEILEFDVDQLYDYRSRRPRVKFVEDHFEDVEMPRLVLHAVTDGLGQDFLLLAGPEPDLQWRRFEQAVLGLVEVLDVKLYATVAGMPMPVPHTRPLPVTAHGSRQDLVRGISPWKPVAELGASVSHVLEVAVTEQGRDTIGYTINVPQYLAEAELPQAAVTALEHLSAATRLNLPADRLREAGREVEHQIDEQVEASQEVSSIVAHLEQRYDENISEKSRRSLLARDESEIPDADELGATIEAFLADHEDDED